MAAPIKFNPELRASIRAADLELPVLLTEAEVRAALDVHDQDDDRNGGIPVARWRTETTYRRQRPI